MAVYGDMLGFFPEIFREFDYFSMSPEITGGYSNRTEEIKIKGVLQNVNSGLLRQEGDTIAGTSHPVFWTRSILLLGYFIKDGETVYRITRTNDWVRQGNFYKYDLESVVGNKDEDSGVEDVVDYAKSTY